MKKKYKDCDCFPNKVLSQKDFYKNRNILNCKKCKGTGKVKIK